MPNEITGYTYIYGLVDPRDSRIHYIGKSDQVIRRWEDHLADKSDTRKTRWLQGLQAVGITPVVVILDALAIVRNTDTGEVFAPPWWVIERQWIATGARYGWPLTNTAWGQGDKIQDGDCDDIGSFNTLWLLSEKEQQEIETARREYVQKLKLDQPWYKFLWPFMHGYATGMGLSVLMGVVALALMFWRLGVW